MIQLDLVGLFLTWLLICPRNTKIGFVISLYQEVSRLLISLFFKAPLVSLTLGGVFGITLVEGEILNPVNIFVLLAGPGFCYVLSKISPGLSREEGAAPFNPWARLANPWAVISWRYALVSTLVCCGYLIKALLK